MRSQPSAPCATSCEPSPSHEPQAPPDPRLRAARNRLAAVALVAAPERRDLILDIYLLVLGGIAVIRFVTLTPGAGCRASARSSTTRFTRSNARRPDRGAGQARARCSWACRPRSTSTTASGRHSSRSRATGWQAAESRSRTSGGRSPFSATMWELLRPDREPPRDRNAPGIGTDELGRVVSVLERISDGSRGVRRTPRRDPGRGRACRGRKARCPRASFCSGSLPTAMS